ncbi:formylglycine-generating enzyme family protein [Streptomyces sp. NPDC087440]|uniref:formylglycine-generating enzyme family protein n=1 Tax=Streptomyces sp. NPDC087440 TaxID=3365790 RepID=UPI00380665A2
MEWIRIPGGHLPAGEWHPAQDIPDLWWAATPLARSNLPFVALPLPHAATLAHALGARVPTSAEWQWMASGGVRRFPWGDRPPGPGEANLRDLGPGTVMGVRSCPTGRTPEGLWEVAGNVWEWTAAPWRRDRVALLRGGSYNSLTQYAECTHANDVPAGLSSLGIGIRPVRNTPPGPPTLSSIGADS